MKNTPQFRRSAIAVAVATAFASQLSPASSPVTGEFLVNELLTGNQSEARVARAADGRFVVVWTDQNGSDGSGHGIKARVYGANGQPASGEFTVNVTTASTQNQPDVAMEPDGDFVVAWHTYPDVGNEYGTGYGINARRFDATGAALTGEIHVNNVTSSSQARPAVAVDADGDFVVVWQSYNQTGDLGSYGIFARRFNAAGTPAANSFRINNQTVDHQTLPDIASDAAGNFVVVWQTPDNNSGGISARRFDNTGTALAPQFQVPSTQNSNQREPTVAVDADGDFIVAWGDARGTVDGGDYSYNIFARRYNGAGVAQGADILVNETLTNTQLLPSIATDADGDFTVAWQSYRLDGTSYSYGISARRFSGGGVAQTSDLLVNVFTDASQRAPAVAADADGDFVVVWQSYSQEVPGFGGQDGVVARRYSGGEDVDLSIAASGPASRAPSQSITYTIAGTNHHAVSTATGNATIDAAIGAAGNLTVATQLDADSEFLSASGTNWTCDNAGNDVTCTYDIGLAPQATTNTLTLRAFGPETQASDTLVAANQITADQPDAAQGNNEDDVTTAIACNRGTISLTWTAANFSESVGTADVAVSRHGGSCGAATVAFATSNGSATAGSDYTDSDQTVSWVGGEAGAKFISVPIAANATDEAHETINIALSGATGAALGTPASAVLTILDDDDPVVNFTSAGQTVGEDAGVVTLTATTTVVSDVALVLTLGRSGSANAADLSGVPTTLTIPAGDTSASATFSVVDDNRYEPVANTSIFTITKVTARATRGATKVHTVTINDNDPQPVLTFERASDLGVGEGASRTVRFQLDRPSDETISVPYGPTGASTATLNVDYTLGQGSPVVFAPGSTSKALIVRAINDTETEGIETAVLEMTPPANVTPGANLTYTFEIRASD